MRRLQRKIHAYVCPLIPYWHAHQTKEDQTDAIKKICTRLGLFTLVPGFQNGSIHNQWDVSNRGLYRLTSLVSLLVCDGPRRDNRERPSV